MSEVESIQVRRFSQAGIDEFTSIIRRKDPTILSQINTLINDDSFTELIKVGGKQVFMDIKPILRRLEMAEHLFEYFGPGETLGHLSGDVGLWNWLSAAWMQPLLSAASEPLRCLRQVKWWNVLLVSAVFRLVPSVISPRFSTLIPRLAI